MRAELGAVAIAVTTVISACAQAPIHMVPIHPAKFASPTEMQSEKMAAGARCQAVAMNSMGPPASPQQAPTQINNVAQSAVIVSNAPQRSNGLWDWSAVNGASPPINYQFPADNTDWNAVRENQIRYQRADANFFACMADAGFIRAHGQ